MVPVVRLAALERWGTDRVSAALDAVSAALSTEELRALNRQAVDTGPVAAAHEFAAERVLAG